MTPRRRRPDETVEEYSAAMQKFKELEQRFYGGGDPRSSSGSFLSNLFQNKDIRTNIDAPQTGLSAAQHNIMPGPRNITGRQNISNLRTNNPVEVAGLGNVVSDLDGSMYDQAASPALSDYMAPQEDMTAGIVEKKLKNILEQLRADEEASKQRGEEQLANTPPVDYMNPAFGAGKLNQNIPGNIYAAKHGGSVFRNAYDQASNIMHRARGGGLEGLKESIDINGQPHNLAYINPSEANLLEVLGGSGQKVNGIPAFQDIGDIGDYDYSIDESDYPDDPGYGVDEGAATSYQSASKAEQDAADRADEAAYAAALEQDGNIASLYAGLNPEQFEAATDTIGPFGRAYSLKSASQDVYAAAATDKDNWRSDIANDAERINARLEKEGYNQVETAYFNAMKERGMTNAEAQMAVAQAFAIAGEKTMTEHYETGYKYGGAAETMQDYMENYAEGHNEAMEAALERANEERDREIATNPDEYDLEAYEDEELGVFNLTGLVGKSLVGGDKLNEFQLQAAQDMFPNATITARSDMDINIGTYGPWVAGLLPGPMGRVWGIANAVAKIFGENIVGWMDRPGMPTMSIRANGDVRYDTDPVATDEDSYQIMTERIIKEKPIVEEDLTEEEEEEKSSIADLVGLEGDIVERLSLQNARDILQSIYGPDYEPF